MPVNNTIQIRKGTSDVWTSTNPVLAIGEPGFETDTKKFKIGNGTNSWNSLEYAFIVPSGLVAGSGISIAIGPNSSYTTISAIAINNYANDRILTSDGTPTGINAESGLIFNGSGLSVNGTGVSLNGHTHTASNITDFGIAVSGFTSGLQPLLSNPVTGTGTTGYLPKWVSTSGINNSIIFENESNIGIGTTAPIAKVSISNGFFAVDGDSQILQMTLRKETSDNTETNLYIDNISKKMVIPLNTSWNFRVDISCISQNTGGAASFSFRGCIKRTDTTTFVGSYLEDSFIDSSLNGIDAYLLANNSTNTLDILVQGLVANTIRWTAGINIVQSSFATNNYFNPMNICIIP